MTRTQTALFAASIGILATLFVADNREHQLHHQHYCELVQIHNESRGLYGQPEVTGEKPCN